MNWLILLIVDCENPIGWQGQMLLQGFDVSEHTLSELLEICEAGRYSHPYCPVQSPPSNKSEVSNGQVLLASLMCILVRSSSMDDLILRRRSRLAAPARIRQALRGNPPGIRARNWARASRLASEFTREWIHSRPLSGLG